VSPLLAEVGIAFGFVLVVVLAVVVAVVGAFGLAFKVLVAIVRTVFGTGKRQAIGGDDDVVAVAGRRTCGDPGCGEENVAEAVYCRQCGRRLTGRG